MLTQICQYLRNWFEREKFYDTFAVNNGEIEAASVSLDLQQGQYFRIVGSIFNDGVHRYGEADLTAENAFDGSVWALAIPGEIIDLADEISAWITANQSAINSPYQSESFAGYSYTLKSGNTSGSATDGVTWQSQFAARLAPWRKI